MKKSLVVIALVVAALCSLFVFSVSATEQENIHISSTEFQVRQGSEFTTTIYIADNANIIDFEVLLKYDTDKLTLISATENEDIKGAVVINAETAGSIGINYSRTSDNVNKQTMLVDLTFRVDEYLPAGVYDCLTVDTSGSYVAHRLVNGLLEEVDFNCEFAPLSIYEIGDVDLNNKVDIGDATYIRRHLAKLHTLTEFQLLFANAQNDGLVDIADAVALQRNLAKLEVDNYGDRVNVLFCNTDGEILTKKSVQIGANLNTVPDVPLLSGHTNGRWSLSKTEYVAPDYTNLTSELTVYAIYEKSISPYMQYYMAQVNNIVNQYNGVITSDWTLPTNMVYASNTAYTGTIDWSSSDANVFSNTGVFNEQTYDKTITLTTKIYSYLDSTTPESSETLTFTLLAKGAYSTPTKAEIVNYLKNVTNGTLSGTSTISGGEIDCDLNLIRKISNEQVGSTSGSVYEVRIEWVINNNGVYEPISQIKRGTSAKTIDLVATITFNGEPLEDDGKVYFDDVSLTAITEDEIRRYIIGEIASKVENSFSNGDALWTNEDNYGCEIKWISKDINTVVIEQNTVTVNEQAINGTTCPITVQVTYPTDAGSNSFDLEYVITVENPNNTLLRPGANISDSLYYALMIEMRDRFGYTQLTTEALKNTKFVSLDLSKYNDWFEDGAGELHAPITDLTGLTYCENLRLLNISGLNITSGISEIAGLTYLESFIANNVGISSEAVGGTPILSNMINLKLVDLSSNNLTSLDMFFSSDDIYSKLKELYLDNNNLSDISLLSQTPMLTLLTLSNNNIDSDDISVLADKVYLTYLSLNNNNISSISSLNKLTALTELRLHCNNISDITALKNMTAMTKLYLGENNIGNIDNLEKLTLLEVLYLNDNAGVNDIAALAELTAMQILNISNCSVNQIISLQNMSALKELYAENNEITGFATLSKFTNMEKLLLAGNERSGQTLEWNKYLGGMANLKVLTLSGLDVSDLSFLETVTTDSSTQATTTTIKPIQRLEIANCGITSTYTNDETTVDNMDMIKQLDMTLKYLDISSNPIDTNIDYLGFLSSLELLYADNINIGDAIVGVMANSQSMKYLSLENCNISNMYNNSGKPWLSTSRKYVFVDLAQNPIAGFDFTFVENSAANLQYLYLDTAADGAILTSNSELENNVLIYLSLAGFKMDSIELLPNMENLVVLNISNTNISDLFGVENNGSYTESIARFEHVKYLDISGNDGIFTQSNLNLLYDTFADSETLVYLYEDHSKVGFDAAREAETIRGFITDIPAMSEKDRAKIHSFYENPYTLQGAVHEYALAWTIAENAWFAVEDNTFSVYNWDMRENHTLMLTAPLDVYVNDDTRESITFSIYVAPSPYNVIKYANTAKGANMDVVSTETRYFNVGWDNNLTVVANDDYDFAGWYTALYGSGTKLEKGYIYHEVDANGNVPDLVSYAKWTYNVTYDLSGGTWTVTTPNTTYVSNEWISLPAETTLAKTGYTFGGWSIGDTTFGKSGTVEAFGHTTLSATWTTNPFNVIVYDGNEIRTSFASEYDAIFDFIAINNTKTGYTFSGWYYDAQFTKPVPASVVLNDSIDEIVDGVSVVCIWGKWAANTYTVFYNADGGSVSPTSKTATYDSAYGTHPVPTRTGYTFTGWYLNGKKVENTTIVKTAANHTLVAGWRANNYAVSYNANGGSVSPTSKTVTYDSAYGTLPMPTRTGYTFTGWYLNGKKVENTTIVKTAANHMLVAEWTANTYNITLNTNGGTINSGNVTKYVYGVGANLPMDVRKDGYIFAGWYTANNGQGEFSTSISKTAVNDKTYYAYWVQTKNYSTSATNTSVNISDHTTNETYTGNSSFNVVVPTELKNMLSTGKLRVRITVTCDASLQYRSNYKDASATIKAYIGNGSYQQIASFVATGGGWPGTWVNPAYGSATTNKNSMSKTFEITSATTSFNMGYQYVISFKEYKNWAGGTHAVSFSCNLSNVSYQFYIE